MARVCMRERRARIFFIFFIINYNCTRDSWTTTASGPGWRGERGEGANETVYFFILYATPQPAAHKTMVPSGAPHARGSAAAATPHAARPIASIFIALSALSAIIPTHASIAHANTVACTRYTSTASVAIGPNARGTATHVPRHPKK